MRNARITQSRSRPTFGARFVPRWEILEILIAVLVIAACQASPSGPTTGASPAVSPRAAAASPSPTVVPSVGSSAAPSATASPGPTSPPMIVVDDMVRTSAPGLEVRPRPDPMAAPIVLGGPLAAGALLFVAAGPVAAGGSDWYFVMPFDVGPAGWATTSDATGTPLVVLPETDRCPEAPLDPQDLLDLGSFGGLACFGRTQIRVVGNLTCQEADVDRAFGGPDWLAFDHRCTIDLGGGQEFEVHDRGLAALQPTVLGASIVGHFDDAQAATCAWGVDPPTPDPIAIVTSCRAMFVATTILVGP